MASQSNTKWWEESIRLKEKNKRRSERRANKKQGKHIKQENTNTNTEEE